MVMKQDLQEALDAVELRFQQVSDPAANTPEPDQETEMEELAANVREIIKTQDKLGRWIVHQDKFQKGGPGSEMEWRVPDRRPDIQRSF